MKAFKYNPIGLNYNLQVKHENFSCRTITTAEKVEKANLVFFRRLRLNWYGGHALFAHVCFVSIIGGR